MPYVIDVQNLNKYFGSKHVVQDVSLQVRRGSITGFLGPNGSGKTTTLRLLCGLLTASSGTGTVLGRNLVHDRQIIKEKTGYMTQKFSLYDDLTIEENLVFVGRIRQLPNYKQLVEATLDRLGLHHRKNQLAGTLSGGWKQRLALAAATLHTPDLLLLDEPTAGVDPMARREFWDAIHALADNGLTVLVSTHYMDEAERCHDIGYILHGKIIARGTAHDIIESSKLTTFAISGAQGKAQQIIDTLLALPNVITASPFGQLIHVSGTNKQALEQDIRSVVSANMAYTLVPSTLEDIFIYLMLNQEDKRYSV